MDECNQSLCCFCTSYNRSRPSAAASMMSNPGGR